MTTETEKTNEIINYNCSICEKDFKTEKEYNKHFRNEEHEKNKVSKGIYSFGCCPYCRLHLYLLQLPEHIKGCHKEHYDNWKDTENINEVNKIILINNKLKEMEEINITENKEKEIKEVKTIIKPVKHRRGKYRHMTDEQIKQHKKLLTKERQRRFYEKHRTRYKDINIKNYEKRKSKTEKRRGRPPVYND